VVIAKGGRGGLGNLNFASSANQAPALRARRGPPAASSDLVLELKLLADVGIVGYPQRRQDRRSSAGICRAQPQNRRLPVHHPGARPRGGGVARRASSFVVADIPGLIEWGARPGRAWATSSCADVERCRVLVHLVEGANPGRGRVAPAKELGGDRPRSWRSSRPRRWRGKPQVVAVTKVDLPEARARRR
jgi:GTP-binding protein